MTQADEEIIRGLLAEIKRLQAQVKELKRRIDYFSKFAM